VLDSVRFLAERLGYYILCATSSIPFFVQKKLRGPTVRAAALWFPDLIKYLIAAQYMDRVGNGGLVLYLDLMNLEQCHPVTFLLHLHSKVYEELIGNLLLCTLTSWNCWIVSSHGYLDKYSKLVSTIQRQACGCEVWLSPPIWLSFPAFL